MNGMDHYLQWRGPPVELSPSARFASNQEGEDRIGEDGERGRGVCVRVYDRERQKETHKKTGGERVGVQNPIDFTRVLNPNTAVFYICECVQTLTKDICICNTHFNAARGQRGSSSPEHAENS